MHLFQGLLLRLYLNMSVQASINLDAFVSVLKYLPIPAFVNSSMHLYLCLYRNLHYKCNCICTSVVSSLPTFPILSCLNHYIFSFSVLLFISVCALMSVLQFELIKH